MNYTFKLVTVAQVVMVAEAVVVVLVRLADVVETVEAV